MARGNDTNNTQIEGKRKQKRRKRDEGIFELNFCSFLRFLRRTVAIGIEVEGECAPIHSHFAETRDNAKGRYCLSFICHFAFHERPRSPRRESERCQSDCRR